MSKILKFSALLSGVHAVAVKNPQLANVVQMLGDMKNTCKAEIAEQEKAWVTFRQWCDDTNSAKEKEIERTSIDLDEAKAGSLSRKADIGKALSEKTEAMTESSVAADDLKAILAQREAANAIYKDKKNELEDSIGACEQAADVLSKVPDTATASTASTGAASLLQSGVLSSIANKKGSRFTAIRELIQLASGQTPQGKNYAIQKSSGAILQMIEDLKASFEDELSETEKAESNDSEAYQLEKQSTTNKKQIADDLVKSLTQDIATLEGEKATYDNDVQSFSKSLKAAKTYSKKLGTECEVKAKDYIRESKSRADELTAIDSAVEILSGAAIDKAGKVLSAPAPGVDEDTAAIAETFIQLTSNNGPLVNAAAESAGKRKIISFLKGKAATLGSRALFQLASLAEADPFGKIKKLIGDLITQLSHERMAEIEKANACDSELADSARKIEASTNEMNKAATDKMSLESKIETKAKEIEEKSSFLQNSDKSLAELTTARAEESAANTKALKELNEGAAALAAAITVLTDFYDKAAASFVQTSMTQPLNADFEPTKSYGGNDASEGILTLLTQIETDMRSQIVEIETSEKESVKGFTLQERELTTGSAAAKADLNTYKGQLASMQGDLKETEETLETSTDTLKKEQEYKRVNLDAKCIETGVSYEDRNAKRQEEIQSLQDALKILQQVAP